MKYLSSQNRSFFENCGRRGGKKRARQLLPEVRASIASHAARVRWKKEVHTPPFSSIRFEKPNLENPTYLEELLCEGSLRDWKVLYRKIADRPFGSVSEALKKVLNSTESYGGIPLWSGILGIVQGRPYEK